MERNELTIWLFCKRYTCAQGDANEYIYIGIIVVKQILNAIDSKAVWDDEGK